MFLQARELAPYRSEARAVWVENQDKDVVLLEAHFARGPQHAVHFSEHLQRVGNVLEDIPAVHKIEPLVLKGQSVRISAKEMQIGPAPGFGGG